MSEWSDRQARTAEIAATKRANKHRDSVGQICPGCGIQTKYLHRPNTPERRAAVNREYPNAVWAATADGTCDKCWRFARGTKHNKPAWHKKIDDERLRLASVTLAAYMRERRARGVDPEGCGPLDEEFERDWEDIRKQKRREAHQKRLADKKAREEKERLEREGMETNSETGRPPVPALRVNGNARASAPEEPGNGRVKETGRAYKHHRALRTI